MTVAMFTYSGELLMTGTTSNSGSPLPSGYLGTNGNQIVDQTDNNIRIASDG